jgi:hypothetical protein
MGIPKREDGVPIFMPLSFEDYTFLYVCGAGDHPTNGRGEGNKFKLSRSTSGESTVEWQFNDPVKIVGGYGKYDGASGNDEISMEVYAPATTVESVTPGTGSVILVDTGYDTESGDLYIVVPYPGGTHNVTEAIPVPASVGEDSFYSWTPSTTMTGAGDIAVQVSGGFNLYTSDIPLARQVSHLQLYGSGDLNVEVSNVKPLIMLPQWKFKATLTTDGTRDVTAIWELKVTRTRTTKIW